MAQKSPEQAEASIPSGGKGLAALCVILAVAAALLFAAATVSKTTPDEIAFGLQADRPIAEIVRYHSPSTLLAPVLSQILPFPIYAVLFGVLAVWAAFSLARRLAPEHPALMAAATSAFFFPAIAAGTWNSPDALLGAASVLTAAGIAAAFNDNHLKYWAGILTGCLIGAASSVFFAIPALALLAGVWIFGAGAAADPKSRRIIQIRATVCVCIALAVGVAIYFPQRYFLVSDLRYLLSKGQNPMAALADPSRAVFVALALLGAFGLFAANPRARWLALAAPLILAGELALAWRFETLAAFNALVGVLCLGGVAAVADKSPALKAGPAGLGLLVGAPALALAISIPGWLNLANAKPSDAAVWSEKLDRFDLSKLEEARRSGQPIAMPFADFEKLEGDWPLPGGWMARLVDVADPENVFAQDDTDRLIENGQIKNAENAVRAALKSEPYRIRLLAQYAKILLMNGNPDKAEYWAARALALSPDRIDVLLLMHDIRVAQNQLDEARKILQNPALAGGLIELEGNRVEYGTPADCAKADTFGRQRMHRLARAFEETSQSDAAQACLQTAGEIYQAIDRAAAMAAQENYADAAALLSEIEEKEPDRFDLSLRLAEYLFKSGDTKNAKRKYLKIQGFAPNLLESNRQLVELYMAELNLYQALNLNQAIVENNRNDTEARLGLADIYRIMGSIPEAEREYNRVLEVEPGNGRAIEGLQRLQMSPALRMEGIQREGPNGRSGPGERGGGSGGPDRGKTDQLKKQAEAAARQGDWNEVADLTRQAAEIDPKDIQAHAMLARALLTLGRPEEALNEIKIIEKQGAFPDSLRELKQEILSKIKE